MSVDSAPTTNVLHYVSQLRKLLHNDVVVSKETLSSTQNAMKSLFDKKSTARSFKPGDKVLVL